MGGNTLGRDWDLNRTLENYEDRINVLEKLARARGVATSAFLVDTPRWKSGLSGSKTTTTATNYWVDYTVASGPPDHDPATTSNSFFVYSASAGQHRYTAQSDGLYYVRAAVQWAQNGAGTRKLSITVDNAGDAVPVHTSEVTPNANASLLQVVQGPVGLAAGGFIRVNAWQNSGGNLDITHSQDVTSALGGGRAGSFLHIFPIGAYAVA
jgi:hypothetical protein